MMIGDTCIGRYCSLHPLLYGGLPLHFGKELCVFESGTMVNYHSFQGAFVPCRVQSRTSKWRSLVVCLPDHLFFTY